jgi:hypothetical protein
MEQVHVSERDQHLKSQIIIIIITFMQDIYNYIPVTNHISGVYNFVSVLWIQFMFHVMLYPQMCHSIRYVPKHVCNTQCPVLSISLMS